MVNIVIVMGRLTKDPEVKKTTSGKSVLNVCLACERDFKSADGEKKTDFFDVVAWGSLADYIEKYYKKGNLLNIAGQMQNNVYENSEGKRITRTEIKAERCFLTGERRASSFAESDADQNLSEPGFADLPMDDDDYMVFGG